MILVEGQIPTDQAFRPVPGDIDDQLDLLLKNFALLPIAAGTFGHPDLFVRKTLVEFILRRRAAAVAVRGDASRKNA